jgi:DNA-binding Lrp family transcriptional regulator
MTTAKVSLNEVDKSFPSCVLDDIDKQLLQLLQDDFPLVEYPWRELGSKVGVSEKEVISRVEHFFSTGVVRKLGPVVDLPKVGYTSTTLIALRVPENQVDNVASVINQYGNISHNYEREHEYNVWFTLVAKSKQELASTLSEILQKTGLSPCDVLDLSTVKRFKINLNFLVSEL